MLIVFYTVSIVCIGVFMTSSISYCLCDTRVYPWNICMYYIESIMYVHKHMYIYAVAVPTVFMGLATGLATPLLACLLFVQQSDSVCRVLRSAAPLILRLPPHVDDGLSPACHSHSRGSIPCQSASDAWLTDWLGYSFISEYFGCSL
jgi:hypothetical protein